MRFSSGVGAAIPSNKHAARTKLIQRINGETGQKFGIEVSGLLWQYIAGESDVANLLHARRIHQKSDIRFATANSVQRFSCIAQVRNILLMSNGLLGQSQHILEQHFVQLNDVERLLSRGQ